ncbi:MAG: hypothetical protein JNK48_24310 [Bryobacterales bacterium]|nr:hypothetical protein [Bryobacterales bacterium]
MKLALLLMMPLLAAAAEDWDRVRAIPAGTMVKVRTFEGVESKGALEAVDDAFVRVKHRGQTVNVARADAGRVSVHDAGRRARNAVIGGAIGVAVGIVAAFASCPTCSGELPGGEANERLAVGAAVGGAAGAGIGAALAPYKTVYKAKRK